MNIPASIRRPFTASGAHNGAVNADGDVDFSKAPTSGFAWTQSRVPVLPFIPAARYYIGDLSQAARECVIQDAVDSAQSLQRYCLITGASVTADASHLEVWTRPGWHPGCAAEIRTGIEAALAPYEKSAAPANRFTKLFYSADRDRAQRASDRRESFIENYADAKLFKA